MSLLGLDRRAKCHFIDIPMPAKDNKFLWGVATSAFQVEGKIQNDMTEWEAQGRFRENGKNPIYNEGVRHWDLWEDDFRLLRRLMVNSYRFSVEWSRLEPEEGKFNREALSQYDRMIDKLLEYEIAPMLTLHHFTHPVWFHKSTPWHRSTSIESYERYVNTVARLFADRVNYFVTFNEPLVWLLAGYGDAKFPPGIKSFKKLMDGLVNMLKSHRRAYEIIKGYNRDSNIGIAQNFIIFDAARKESRLDGKIRELIHNFYNLMIPEVFLSNRLRFHFPLLLKYEEVIPLDNKIDFWGINYYYRMHLRFKLNFRRPFHFFFERKSEEGVSDMGWEIYSTGLYKILEWLKFTEKPLYVTENGIASDDDSKRLNFLRIHLGVVEWAIKNGYPLKGYFHWSLMDNYEWLEGYAARFGLYSVDLKNDYSRNLKESGRYYADYLRNKRRKSGEIN